MNRQRIQGVPRVKVVLSIHPALQYMIEQSAIQCGYVRKQGKFAGKPDHNGYLEDYLKQLMGFDRYTNQQLNQMAEYQYKVNSHRGKV